MGKVFENEINNLSSTYDYANIQCGKVIQDIEYFLRLSLLKPLLLIGSGGSYSAAKAFETLHSFSLLGNIAKTVTPLELSSHVNAIPFTSSVILSANGNNSDTVNAYQFLVRNNTMNSMIVCLNQASKLKKMSREYDTIFTGNRLPTGKDGYLAVNTLFATIIWIAKAYYNILKDEFFLLPEKYEEFDIPSLPDPLTISDYDSIIILHSGLSSPVAVDIESKFSEVALGNVLLADYRNFAHGRHLWLERRGKQTLIISLITPDVDSLANKTLSLIPDNICVMKLITKSIGVKGMIELLLCSFELIRQTASLLGFDPGKPTVPEYGKKMYHISYTSIVAKESRKNVLLPNCALIKKCGIKNVDISKIYEKHYFCFLSKIKSAKFNQLVFDYDSTLNERNLVKEIEDEIFNIINNFLSHGIDIAIATGRGKSVRKEMQEKINPLYWKQVQIGYYNGGVISSLDDNNVPSTDIEVNCHLKAFANTLVSELPELNLELRPTQLTLFFSNITQIAYKDIVLEMSLKHSEIKVVSSGHSIDIVSSETTKCSLINPERIALCIGDSGQKGGNDYELLSHEYSLSVNHTSMDFDSCWNLAPLGLKNCKATLYYLRCLKVEDAVLQFNVE